MTPNVNQTPHQPIPRGGPLRDGVTVYRPGTVDGTNDELTRLEESDAATRLYLENRGINTGDDPNRVSAENAEKEYDEIGAFYYGTKNFLQDAVRAYGASDDPLGWKHFLDQAAENTRKGWQNATPGQHKEHQTTPH